MNLRWRDWRVTMTLYSIITWETLCPVFTRVMFKRFVPKLPPLLLLAAQWSVNASQSQRRRDRREQGSEVKERLQFPQNTSSL